MTYKIHIIRGVDLQCNGAKGYMHVIRVLTTLYLPTTTSFGCTFIADDTIDESYGVAVVFHEDEDEGERGGEGGRGRESMVAHDDEKDMEADDEEGVEAEYDEVLKTAVSLVNDPL